MNNWFNLRDQFMQDGDATKLVNCNHEDAKWLCSLGNPTKELLISLKDDPRAQCYGLIMYKSFLLRGVDYPYAKAWFADNVHPENITADIEQGVKEAIDAGDPLGMVVFGDILRYAKVVSGYKEWYRKAAKMGYYPGIYKYRRCKYLKGDPRRYQKCSMSYAHKYRSKFLCESDEGPLNVQCLFELGQSCDWANHIYFGWLPLIKRSIDVWLIIGRRLGVVKDMRIVIAKILWKQRYLWVH